MHEKLEKGNKTQHRQIPFEGYQIPYFNTKMGALALSPKAKASGQKRKRNSVVDVAPVSVGLPALESLGIEIDSDGENVAVDSGDEEDGSDAESFPELDTRDDSEEDGSDEGENSEEHDSSSSSSYLIEDSEYESDAVEDDSVKVGPKATTVVSKITGRPKRIYPEIEPEYDSDSSTEDVRSFVNYNFAAHLVHISGPKSRREHTDALV